MPVEIKELIIQTAIEDAVESDALDQKDIQKIIEMCAEQVLEIINLSKER